MITTDLHGKLSKKINGIGDSVVEIVDLDSAEVEEEKDGETESDPETRSNSNVGIA